MATLDYKRNQKKDSNLPTQTVEVSEFDTRNLEQVRNARGVVRMGGDDFCLKWNDHHTTFFR